MEVSVLQANLSRIFSENASMKESLDAKSQKIEELNRRIGEILAENQSFVEQSHQQLIARNTRWSGGRECTMGQNQLILRHQ